MYRVIVNSNFPSLFSSKLGRAALLKGVVDQFNVSAACSIVFTDFIDITQSADIKVPSKTKAIESFHYADPTPTVLIADLNSDIFDVGVSKIESIALIAPLLGKESREKTLDSLVNSWVTRAPDARISVFQIGRIIPSSADLKGAEPQTRLEVIQDNLYPILSQFLPVKYREIEPAHLAQAIRLNYETCERMSLSSS
jgi:hypothetical protein